MPLKAFMHKYFLTLILFVTSAIGAFAQISNKINADLYRLTLNKENRNRMVDVLVKGNLSKIQSISKGLGRTMKYSMGDIAALKIPVSSINKYLEDKDIVR